MKKCCMLIYHFAVLIVIVLVCIGGLLSLLFLLHGPEEFNTVKVKTFYLTEYQWEIQTFSTDQNVGEVTDQSIAIKNAKSLWLEKYSVDIPKRKIEIAYDSKEECWHVYSTQSSNIGIVSENLSERCFPFISVAMCPKPDIVIYRISN